MQARLQQHQVRKAQILLILCRHLLVTKNKSFCASKVDSRCPKVSFERFPIAISEKIDTFRKISKIQQKSRNSIDFFKMKLRKNKPLKVLFLNIFPDFAESTNFLANRYCENVHERKSKARQAQPAPDVNGCQLDFAEFYWIHVVVNFLLRWFMI